MNGTVLRALPFPEMVANMQKKMGSQVLDVLHACVGLAGEAAELAVAREIENVVEELGDLEFYVEACFQALGGRVAPKPIVLDDHDPAGGQCLSSVPLYIMVIAGHLLDKVKKSWVHGRELNEHGIRLDLLRLEVAMRTLRDVIQVRQADVLGANQAKLGRRYPQGVYAAADALARADKDPAHDDGR